MPQELAHLPLHLDLLSETAQLQHGEVKDMELMASDGLRAARVTKVRWSRASQAAFLPSRAHRWHQVSRLLSLPSRKSKTKLAFTTAPRCLLSSSCVWLLATLL